MLPDSTSLVLKLIKKDELLVQALICSNCYSEGGDLNQKLLFLLILVSMTGH